MFLPFPKKALTEHFEMGWSYIMQWTMVLLISSRVAKLELADSMMGPT